MSSNPILVVCLIVLLAVGIAMYRADSGQHAPAIASAGGELTPEQALRRQKAGVAWYGLAQHSYDRELVGFMCDELEAHGLADQWPYLLAYGEVNFGLTVGGVAPGPCYGPWDVKWCWARGCRAACADLVGERAWTTAILTDPYVNTRCAVLEMAHYHRPWRSGLDLLAKVFYPADPGRAAHMRRRWAAVVAQIDAMVASMYRKAAAGEIRLAGEEAAGWPDR
ncbi:MAG: hypothetical protein AB7Y46_01675 [Armatimonadota bacterium]